MEEGFISPSARQIIVSAPTAKELVKKLEVKIKKEKLLHHVKLQILTQGGLIFFMCNNYYRNISPAMKELLRS